MTVGFADASAGNEPSGIRHEALIYTDLDGFLAGTVPFVREGLENGEPVLVAVSRANTTLLEVELGMDASDVCFAEIEEIGRNPARLIPFWRDFLDRNGGGGVCGVGEPLWPGRGAAEVDECQRHESLLNAAFAASSVWSLLCPYDGRALPETALHAVACSHPAVMHDGIVEQSSRYAAEADCFAGELSERPHGVEELEFDLESLAGVRRQVRTVATSAGLAGERVADLATAASELAANSIAHGGGSGGLSLWRERDRLIAELRDAGAITDPMAGRRRPLLTQEGGRGLWLAHQLCDLVQVRSGPSGTTVRLQAILD